MHRCYVSPISGLQVVSSSNYNIFLLIFYKTFLEVICLNILWEKEPRLRNSILKAIDLGTPKRTIDSTGKKTFSVPLWKVTS